MKYDGLDAMCDDERLMVKAEGGDRAVLCKRPDTATLRSRTFNGRQVITSMIIMIKTLHGDAAEIVLQKGLPRPKK